MYSQIEGLHEQRRLLADRRLLKGKLHKTKFFLLYELKLIVREAVQAVHEINGKYGNGTAYEICSLFCASGMSNHLKSLKLVLRLSVNCNSNHDYALIFSILTFVYGCL